MGVGATIAVIGASVLLLVGGPAHAARPTLARTIASPPTTIRQPAIPKPVIRTPATGPYAQPVSSKPFSGAPDQLADCIFVDSRSTSNVGCELKTDFVAARPNPNLPGIPVYDDTGPTPGAVVGYIVPGIDQFVPLALTSDPETLTKLKACNRQLMDHQLVDATCVRLLEAMGTQKGFFPPGTDLGTTTSQP